MCIYLAMFLSGCTLLKGRDLFNQTRDFEVSNYILNHVSKIPIVITGSKLTINLVNSASAEKIILHFKADENKKISEMAIQCMSQCGIELTGELDRLQVENLKLVNAHLLTHPSIKVDHISILASEAIITGIPIGVHSAEISINSSPNMVAVQKLLKGVNIIPGSGEFVYDTKIVYNSSGKAINSHNNEGISDASYNIKVLTKTFPSLKWAAPVVSWFGVVSGADQSNMDVSKLKILPGVADKSNEASEVWKVGGYLRHSAHLISKDEGGRANYGGAINDDSLLRYVQALRDSKLKVMFYPMINMDVPGKSWRGHIKASNPNDIHHFFTKKGGYNEFILHYANLLKGKVDAFVIGSEMQDLTQSADERYSYSDPRRYPAVLEFINLAQQVKVVLGPDVIVTYAANWAEYHHDKSSFHHLDSLWMSKWIDVIGIDAYLPITNKSMGDISIEDIKEGWASGELWDYYYDRNKKASIMPEWGLKQIEYWWSNEHWSHEIKSSWEPKAKPIWFTEFGFPSMHMATNTPDVFWNPKAVNGGVPKKSSGKPDFAIQMRAIRATIEYWQQKSDVVQNMFLWAWDARPFWDARPIPQYNQKLDIWSDRNLWSRGHWINGKIEPLSYVRLLPNAIIEVLETNADELVIEKNSTITQILAKNIEYVSSGRPA